jgi:hypothetical protein
MSHKNAKEHFPNQPIHGHKTYWSLLQNAPHWEFEATVEFVTAIPSFFIGQWLMRRHDRKHHV